MSHRHSFIYKSNRPWPNKRLKRAAIVGHTTPVSARLWLRTSSPGNFTVLLWTERDQAERDRGRALRALFEAGPPMTLEVLPEAVRRVPFSMPNWSTDSTGVLDLEDLEPDREYAYALYCHKEKRVVIGQDRLGRSLAGERLYHGFRTPPRPAPDRAFSFGLYSCHRPYADSIFGDAEVVKMQMWDYLGAALEARRGELAYVIGGGDQAYTDGVGALDIWKYLDGVAARDGDELHPSEGVMRSWYRDVFRGYWGFPALQRVFARFPQYMIWDDHELGDGWGSHYTRSGSGLRKVLPTCLDREEDPISEEDGRELLRRMYRAGCAVYAEYEHSHNPPTSEGCWDYAFTSGCAATFVLDGRGHRTPYRQTHRVLGHEQVGRFRRWIRGLDPAVTPFVFVVAAVPVLHLRTVAANADSLAEVLPGGLGDDLRDSWEHELHDAERGELVDLLFDAAGRGFKPCILSGDVHISAAFRMSRRDPESARTLRVYQLTSSAITYSVSRTLGWALSAAVPDADYNRADRYHFERLALYADSNFAILSAQPAQGQVVFELFGDQRVDAPPGHDGARPLTRSLAKLELRWD